MKCPNWWIIENEEAVYAHYLSDTVEVGEMYISPLRSNDTNASFGLFMKEGKILWKDFGLEQEGFDCVALVQHLYGIGRLEACRKILSDVKEGSSPSEVRLKKRDRSEMYAYVKARKHLRKSELDWWKQYGVSGGLLRQFDVCALDELWINDFRLWEDSLSFLYDLPNEAWQAYRPGKPSEFKNWSTFGVVLGEGNLFPSKELYITSSMKDLLVLKTLDYQVLAPLGENNLNPISRKIFDIGVDYEDIYCIFDGDNAGKEASASLEKKTGVTPLYLNYPEGTKDPADVVKLYGKEYLEKLIQSAKNNNT